jgi:TetR/AcrR family transcriptional repressor of nem operon
MASARDSNRIGTAARIMDAAQRFVQLRGFNAFSYADVAAELNVTTAALHYHFASKAELGEALISRYLDRFTDALRAASEAGDSAVARLEAYIDLHASVLSEQKLCLCGMLAAEYHTLPPAMQTRVTLLFDRSEEWLEQVLDRGRAEGSMHFSGPARDAALMIVAVVEGGMLVASPRGDVARFRAGAAMMLAGLQPGAVAAEA